MLYKSVVLTQFYLHLCPGMGKVSSSRPQQSCFFLNKRVSLLSTGMHYKSYMVISTWCHPTLFNESIAKQANLWITWQQHHKAALTRGVCRLCSVPEWRVVAVGTEPQGQMWQVQKQEAQAERWSSASPPSGSSPCPCLCSGCCCCSWGTCCWPPACADSLAAVGLRVAACYHMAAWKRDRGE